MASSAADATSPATAALRAAAASVLDASSAPVLGELAAARKTATETVDAMIYANQFPADCNNARLLLCSIDKDCGFACQLHHGVHLLALALATNRTLVLYAEEWRYGKEREGVAGRARGVQFEQFDDDQPPNPNLWARSYGIHTAAPASLWERVFARVTHCATGGDDWLATLPQFRRGQEHHEARAVVATVIDGEALPYDPPSVPRDIMHLVSSFHSRPEVWWVGALARYLLRPAAAAPSSATKEGFTTEENARRTARLGLLPGQYIGMHIRRTDKVEQTVNERGDWPAEAARHELSEYVEAAEAWHAEMSNAIEERKTMIRKTGARAATMSRFRAGSFRSNLPSVASDEKKQPRLTVYLATDDASLASQAPRLYPHIRWVTNPVGATAAAVHRRNSLSSLLGVVDDLYFLSHADAIIGSFTSQVSRLAYELLQHEHTVADASLRYHSVDVQWYFGGGPPMRWCVRWRQGWADVEEEADLAVVSAAEGNEVEASGVLGKFAGGFDVVGDKAESRNRVNERRKELQNQARPVGEVASSIANKINVLLCEADVVGVQGRVRCRSEESSGAWVDVPVAALERCRF